MGVSRKNLRRLKASHECPTREPTQEEEEERCPCMTEPEQEFWDNRKTIMADNGHIYPNTMEGRWQFIFEIYNPEVRAPDPSK